MPVACSQSAISGSEGSVYFIPSGTSWCLLDYTDFPAGTAITVPTGQDYRVGDPVVFSEEGTANLDSALTAGTTYYVSAVTSNTISVSATSGGSAITLLGDGGTGSANTAGAANHIAIAYSTYAAVCQVATFSIDLTRDEIETTTLPCGVAAVGKFAPTKSYILGYLDASGSMTVYFTPDQGALANRLIANSLLKRQDGARVKLYVSTIDDGTGQPDDAASLFVEAHVSIFGFSLSSAPEDATQAEINFRLSDATNIFGNLIS